MKIRELLDNELDDLLELYQHLHSNDVPRPDEFRLSEVWSKIQSNQDYLCLGIFEDNKLICSCSLVIVANLTRGCRSYGVIENVVTHPLYRKKGYGDNILRHALGEAWSRNCYKVMLQTGRLDEETFRFYEKAGFNRNTKQAFIAKPPSI